MLNLAIFKPSPAGRVWVGLQGLGGAHVLDETDYQIHDQKSKQKSGINLPAGMFSKD